MDYTAIPLCVDLDGTLMAPSIRLERVLRALRRPPMRLLHAAGRGEADGVGWRGLADIAMVDVTSLPMRVELLECLED